VWVVVVVVIEIGRVVGKMGGAKISTVLISLYNVVPHSIPVPT
jgi:hypothetical protein